MMKLKKITTLILALGILALGSAFAAANTGNQPALPDEVMTALEEGAVISFYDAAGNLLWSSDGEVAFDPALLEQVAEVVISDADGSVIKDLPVTTGPNENPVVEMDDSFFGLGILLKEAGITGASDGAGMKNQQRNQQQNREQHQYKEEHQEQHQTKGGCEDGCQNQHEDDHAAHHGTPKVDKPGKPGMPGKPGKPGK